MKATIAATCFVSAFMLISAITQQECEAPHAFTSCAPGATPRITYYYNNGTRRCEEEFGCASTGGNNFLSLGECKTNCPYGEHASSGRSLS
uniref:Putative tick kunitz 53 n=1 Tax=Ixodes ricinus TaxID=34613 RepID=V5IBA8_IXORI